MYHNNFNKYAFLFLFTIIISLSTFSETRAILPYNHVKNQIIFELFDSIKSSKIKENNIEKAGIYYPESKFLALLLNEQSNAHILKRTKKYLLNKKFDKLKSSILRDIRKHGKNKTLDTIDKVIDAFIALDNYIKNIKGLSASKSYFKQIYYLEKNTKIFVKLSNFTFFLKKERLIAKKLYICECLRVIELLEIQSNSLELLENISVRTTILAQIEFLKKEILTHKNRIF